MKNPADQRLAGPLVKRSTSSRAAHVLPTRNAAMALRKGALYPSVMSDPSIIAETDQLRLLLLPADSSTIVVSFSHMDFDGDRAPFWGDGVIRSAGLAGLGIVAKTNNWFPRMHMARVMDEATAALAPYRTRMGYGFSMGAYGAIKFSRALQLTATLALSPQYSIDPRDVFPADQRLTHLFSRDLNLGMAIRAKDIGGRVYVIVDPHEPRDMWNLRRIKAAAGRALCQIHAPGAGHETIDVFADTASAHALFRIAAALDDEALAALTARLQGR